MEGQCVKQNLINSFFTITGVVTVSIVLSSIVIGYYCFERNNDDVDVDAVDAVDAVTEYQKLFLDELDELNEREIDDDKLKELVEFSLRTDTPCGEIIMTYGYETGTFWYFADKTEISFKTLETVARQFCINNDCKNLYIDAKKEQQNKTDADEKAEKTREDEKNNEQKSVFIEYKSYNAPANSYIIKANRFTKKGRIDEWLKIEKQKETMKNINDVTNNLDFNMFKKMTASGELSML